MTKNNNSIKSMQRPIPTGTEAEGRLLNAISTLADPSGLYVLSPESSFGICLGLCTDNRKFSPDAGLTATLSDLVADLLRSYLTNPDGSSARVAIIYNSVEKKPWGHSTFFMEESVVRDAYPVTGGVAGVAGSSLTNFQKRNREKSIYRGMETLLAHKANTGLAIYCPVLFDRGTTLDYYLPMLGRDEQESDRKTPVLEVLNLVANVPLQSRKSPAILELRKKLHAVLNSRHMRKDSGLALVENTVMATPRLPATCSTPAFGGNPPRDAITPAGLMFRRAVMVR